MPQDLGQPPTSNPAAAPVGTTFLAADVGDAGPVGASWAVLDAVLDDAGVAHEGRRWADEQTGAVVAFPSAAHALAAAAAVRRIWREREGADAPLRLAVHTGDAHRDGDGGRHAGPGVSRCRRLRRDRPSRADGM